MPFRPVFRSVSLLVSPFSIACTLASISFRAFSFSFYTSLLYFESILFIIRIFFLAIAISFFVLPNFTSVFLGVVILSALGIFS